MSHAPPHDSPLQHLHGDVHIAETDKLYDDLAGALMASAIAAVQDRGVFHLALSGGSTPEPFYMRMMIDPRYRLIPWRETHLWLVDERCVPVDDPLSNWRLLQETIIDQAPLRKRFLHPMPVGYGEAAVALNQAGGALNPAAAYERELREIFQLTVTSAMPRLDFVLLGMGGDGHTASLFPHSPAVGERERAVVVNDGPTVTPPPRVTMTLPLLNAARQVAVLVTGPDKAAMLTRIAARMRQAGPDPQTLPVTALRPDAGEDALTWYLDEPAAG